MRKRPMTPKHRRELKRDDEKGFHFKLARKTFNRLMKVKRSGESIPRLVTRILTWLYPMLESKHFFDCEKGSRYKHIDGNIKEKRRSVHSPLTPELYRRIKLMHQDLNHYSMAQIIRWAIHSFLELLKKYGDRIFQYLDSLENKWDKRKQKYRSKKLSIRLGGLPGFKEELISHYNQIFSPTKIFLC